MPITEIVDAWCRDHNARTGARRWLLALVLSLLVCFAGYWQTLSPRAIGAAFALTVLWLAFAPKSVKVGQLRAWQ